MLFEAPDVKKKLESFENFLTWATGKEFFWANQNDGGRVREPNTVYGMLRVTDIAKTGTDEIRNKDLGTGNNPRQEILNGLRIINIQLNMCSRSQEHEQDALYSAMRVQTRINYPYVRDTFLTPFELAVNEVSNIVNVPDGKTFDDRIEDVAILNFKLNTVLTDNDAAAVGTYIEQIEFTSQFNEFGETLP